MAVGTDGDRACFKRHDLLYDLYSERISAPMDEVIHVIDNTEIWEIADPFHVFKCQWFRLVHRLSFARVDKPFTVQSLNSILGLGPTLDRLTGIYHMNDVLAITLFTIENCLKLLFAGERSGFYHLLTFSIWLAAIHDPAIPLRCQQQMIELCFRCFTDWIVGGPRSLDCNHFTIHHETCVKYVAELPDLKRYTNSLLFLYKILRNTTGSIVLNRLGTHPVENIFDLVRILASFVPTRDSILLRTDLPDLLSPFAFAVHSAEVYLPLD
jgi:hypothetical protein